MLNAIAQSSPKSVALTQQLQGLAYQRQSKVALWKWLSLNNHELGHGTKQHACLR